MASILPDWALSYFHSFPWTTPRIFALLQSLPEPSVATENGLHRPKSLCSSSSVPEESVQNVESMAFEPSSEVPSTRKGTKVLRPTKHGRCRRCEAPRKPWIYKTGQHAGQATWVCTNLFSKTASKKCFHSTPMTRAEIEDMPRYFRENHSSLQNRLRRGGRLDWQG